MRYPSSAFTIEATVPYGQNLNSVSWSPDGGSIAVGGIELSNGVSAQLYEGLQFPSGNVISKNTVYGNSGNQYPGGFGISGSSIANMIIENVAYNNPQNYAFVTNVFNSMFSNAPSAMQNISIEGNGSIPSPENLACLIKQVGYNVDIIQSLVEGLTLSAIDITVSCDFTSVLDALAVLSSKIDTINCSASEVVVSCNFTSVLDAISQSEATLASELDLISSQLYVIESKLDTIQCSIPEVLVSCDFTSVLDAISASESIIVSGLEVIESQLEVIDNTTNITESIVVGLASQLGVIESKIDNIQISVPEMLVSCDFTSVLDAISISESIIVSGLDAIESQLGVIDNTTNITESIVIGLASQLGVIESKLNKIQSSIQK